MTTIPTTIILAFGVLAMSACRDKLPCAHCSDDVAAEAEDNDDAPLPDLPCGGADLMTDNFNCGSCGHECGLYYPGTEYEAGACKDGACGPGGWSDCEAADVYDPEENCSEICIALGRTCVPNGCAGLTGMMFAVNIDGWGCGVPENTPVATMSGGCDQPIPWMPSGEKPWQVNCCCAFQ
jgi:hypothetical protein